MAFSIDHNSGLLNPSTTISGPGSPTGMASARNAFLYVSDQTGTIAGFSIDANTGDLSSVPGSPFLPTNQPSFSPVAIIANQAVYANDQGGITGFTISPAGELAMIVGSPYPGGLGGQAVLGQSNTTPANYFLFATNVSDPDGAVSVYRIVDPESGILTPVPGNFTTGHFSQPDATLFADISGVPYVFVGLLNSNQVAVFSVDSSTGALTDVPGSPFRTGTPRGLAINLGHNTLYVMDAENAAIYGYKVGNTGVLSQAIGFPVTVGGHPSDMIVTSDDYLYVTLPASNLIQGFSISSVDGGLSSLSASPFAAVGATLLSVVQFPAP